ncbi:Hypothetical predicted protein [Podarcis lilfordi]|uniref:C-type lectin domain-containing protein n=1 Tax=Podarcis lilfordi TaxID=74358 RepID=A0AA35L012_9SAUR|nr:Hypothetical predicted protein [Podarcis lilfordi]
MQPISSSWPSLFITSLVLFCELLVGSEENPSGGCLLDWQGWGDGCYKVFDDPPLSWDEAEEACHKYDPNDHLASLRDAEDLSLLALHLSASQVQHVWIGLSDQDKDGKWEWSDGSEASFMPWGEGEPDNSGVKFCVFLSHQDGFQKFRTDRCPYVVSYVCEHKPKCWGP